MTSADFTKPAVNDETGHCVSCGRDNSGHEGKPCSDDCPMYDPPRLTKGQREFFRAVAAGEHGRFHIRVIEPVEQLGLVLFIGGWRLVGCNSFTSTSFVLTNEGAEFAALDSALVRKAA